MSKNTICLDFDGVVHSYTTKWQGAEIIPDPPVPGAFKFITDAIDAGFSVAIFSTRSKTVEGRNALLQWFINNGFPGAHWLSFPEAKPPAIVYIDDRAFLFSGIFPPIESIKTFKTWQNK